MAETKEQIISMHEQQSQVSVATFKRELQKVRSGRASAGLLEGVFVDYYGSRTPLQSLCQITTPEPRLIVLQVYDAKAVQAIEKAIIGANLGLNPARDGNIIRVSIPALTEETRKDIIRHLHKMAEDIRVSVRNHRRDANEQIKKLEKDHSITQDECKRAQEKIQKLTDDYVKQIDLVLAAKEKEVMEV